jgi:hypothetical protein
VSGRIEDEELGALVSSGDAAVRRLAGEVLRLRSAIESRASKRGHELCWLNDVALWKTVGLESDYPHDAVPVREEFLAQCARYQASRVSGTQYEEPIIRRAVTETAP